MGNGLSHQDPDGADITAAAPAPESSGERRADRLIPFDPTRTVTLAPRPTSDPTPGAGPAAGQPDPGLASRDRRPSRSRTRSTGGSTGPGAGTGADTPTWSPGNGKGKAKGHGSSPGDGRSTPPGHR